MASAKHWVGWIGEKRVYVPSDRLSACVNHRQDGFMADRFTVWLDKKDAERIIEYETGVVPDMKPHIRDVSDVLRSFEERLAREAHGVSFPMGSEGLGTRLSIATSIGTNLFPFRVYAGQKTTLGERRRVFKTMKDIVAEESSWGPAIDIYERTYDAASGFLAIREELEDQPEIEE